MSTVRSFATDGQFKVTDQTANLINIPNKWFLFDQLGIFEKTPVSQYSVTFEEINKTIGVMKDTPRGGRPQTGSDYSRKLRTYSMPQFKEIDAILPSDVQGKRAYGSDQVESLDLVLARKLEKARNVQAATIEVARAQLINNGTVYAPNGNVASVDFYADFGVTRTDVDFVFGTSTTNMVAKTESAIVAIQDNLLSGTIPVDYVAVCSPGFFSKLISHATVVEAYKYYSSNEEPLRKRLNAQGLPLDIRYRSFYFAGVLYIEYRGVIPGTNTPFITANEARFFPLGGADGLFTTFFGPAFKFGYENTLGEEGYLWTYPDEKGGIIEIEHETNFINLLSRPQAVVRAYSSN